MNRVGFCEDYAFLLSYRHYGDRRWVTVYPKAAKQSIPCAPLLSLNGSRVIIAAAELFALDA